MIGQACSERPIWNNTIMITLFDTRPNYFLLIYACSIVPISNFRLTIKSSNNTQAKPGAGIFP